MACHFPVVSAVPVVPVRPLENEIPCGRPTNFQWHSLRAARQLPAAPQDAASEVLHNVPLYQTERIRYTTGKQTETKE